MLRPSVRWRKRVWGMGGDRNLGGLTLLLIQQNNAGKPGRNTNIITKCLQYLKQCHI